MIKSKREEEEKTFALFLSLNYFLKRETRHIISQIGITPHASSSPLRFRPNFDNTRKETTTAFTPTGDDDDESTTGVVALEDATG